MTIGAPYFAFCNFGKDYLNGVAAPNHCRHFHYFLPDVIEFKNDRIRFPAIDARMTLKVFQHRFSRDGNYAPLTPISARYIRTFVRQIVLAIVFALALWTSGTFIAVRCVFHSANTTRSFHKRTLAIQNDNPMSHFWKKWRARDDSNVQPLPSEGSALSN